MSSFLAIVLKYVSIFKSKLKSLGVFAHLPSLSPYGYMDSKFARFSEYIYTEKHCKISIIIM